MQQNIVRFDIPVHYVAFGQDFKGLEHLPEENQTFFLGEGSLFLNEFVHCSSVAKLIDEIEVISSFEHVDVLDYIQAILQVG